MQKGFQALERVLFRRVIKKRERNERRLKAWHLHQHFRAPMPQSKPPMPVRGTWWQILILKLKRFFKRYV